MSVELKIVGNDAVEALHELKTFAGGLPGVSAPVREMVTEVPMPPSSESAPSQPAAPETTASKPARGRGRGARTAAPAPVEPAQNISENPENRVDPEATAQDAADEAAERAAGAAAALTLDDLRGAAQPYIEKHGMEAASKDLMACLSDAVPGKDRFSAFADATQAELAAAVKALQAAGASEARYVAKKA